MQVCTTCLVLSPSHQPEAKYQFSISWKAALARLAVETNKEEGSLPLMIIPDQPAGMPSQRIIVVWPVYILTYLHMSIDTDGVSLLTVP